MKLRIMAISIALLSCVAQNVLAQQAATADVAGHERRVSLEELPVALDARGTIAFAGQLLTKALGGTPDAPVKSARFIIENRSPYFYTYVAGSVTFYNDRGVRCGEGLFTISALAPGEQVETDAPGLRISCTPVSWRIIASHLVRRASEQPLPAEPAEQTAPAAPMNTPAVLPLELVVDGQVYNAPLGSTLEIPVRTRRVRITVRSAQ